MPSPFDARVSVVVLTHNRVFELERTIYHLRRLPERPRIIVVDNGSDDAAMVRRIARFGEVTLVRSDVNLGAAGRNLGVALVDTPYVAFCDDDTWWDPGSLSMTADLLDAHPSVALINARVLVGVHQKEDEACVRMGENRLGVTGWPGVPLISFMAGAAIMRTDTYRAVGGYASQFFLGAEEALMGLDLASKGWHMLYVRDAIVHHHPSPSRDPAARKITLARNRLWLALLRLPMPDCCREIRTILRESTRQGVLLRVLSRAAMGLIWVMRNRNVVPTAVAEMHRRVFADETGRAVCSTTAPEATQSGA